MPTEHNQNPEQRARDKIDRMLAASGWSVQNKDTINFDTSLGVAIREYQTDVGPADYVLFVDRKPVGVIEAKRAEEGQSLSSVEEQSVNYATANLKWIQNKDLLPFVHQSNGEVTYFTDLRDPKPRAREIFTFHRPETYRTWLAKGCSLRTRLQNLPELAQNDLRDCQFRAIQNLETSFKDARPRALVQMATGAGKTFTAITSAYRLLKYADASRILFLVDTRNLGEQAEQEFMGYVPPDDKRKFIELYNVHRLKSSHLPKDNQVYISTVQRLYSILKGDPLEDAAEEVNPGELSLPKTQIPVVYNAQVPIEFFDFIIIDECHRSIYNLWRQVLDYFDAFLIGLTATPDKRTFGFFNENIVSEYPHEEAIADGVNVGHDVYVIETAITKKGGQLEAKQLVEKRDRLTRRKRWEQLDEPVSYESSSLDRDVVNPSQIRNVIRAFRQKLPEIFPGRTEVPKTLIFAKTDSHADDIIRTVREEFAEGNEFCKKVTYQSEEDPKSILAQFRNDFYPRIAVTVDMIATGTDVKPLECLLFMRDVKSKNYFDQMKGRGTRVLGLDDLRKVTPSAASQKTHFVLIDAVGVTKSCKTETIPLERKPNVPLKDLLGSVLMGARDEDTLISLANRLTRLDKKLTSKEQEQVRSAANGTTLHQIVKALIQSCDTERIEERAREQFGVTQVNEPTDIQLEKVRTELATLATKVFTGQLNTVLDTVRRNHEQTIDSVNLDRVTFTGWDSQASGAAEELIKDFAAYIAANKDEIVALSIFYGQPYRRRELTSEMIASLLDKLTRDKPKLAPARVWQAYVQADGFKGTSPTDQLAVLIALIRRVVGIDSSLTTYDQTVKRNFQNWIMKKHQGSGAKFNEEQMEWLRMIRDHICSSFHLEKEDFERVPFDKHGGLGKMWQLFGEETDGLIEELNEVLAA